MPLTLILMRHAKSDWTDPAQDDFDRPLNNRGRRSAPLIAEWLNDKGHTPEHVLLSGAQRTVETWERMAGKLPEPAAVENNRSLYLAGPDVILNVLQGQSATSVMVICHNPGIAMFAEQIVTEPPDHPDFSRYPTAATAVIGFESDTWAGISWRHGRVLDFTVPRDLE